jgi:hypothetical protein
MRHGVIWVGLLKEDRIDHNPAIDEKLVRQSLVHIECVSSILTMMNAHQGYKLSTTFDKSRLYLILVRMVVKRKSVKRVDPLRSTELLNNKLDRGLPTHFAIEINKAALYVKVFEPVLHRPLFAEMVSGTPGFAGTVTGGIDHHIRLKKRPHQIIGDFVVLKKRGKAFSSGRIGHFYKVD